MSVGEPNLRFDDFEDEWTMYSFDDVAETIPSKTFQIPSSEYQNTGSYPVVDQGKGLIAGYSDRKEKVFRNTPIVVFGDHTTELKLVDFPFVVGADGTKLIRSKRVDTTFLYYSMLSRPVTPTGYNRHFSILKQRSFSVPSIEEQRRIRSFLSMVDGKTAHLRQQEASLVRFKTGLMQKLFSQELRFQQDDGRDFTDWEEFSVGAMIREFSNRNNKENHPPASVGRFGIRPRSEVYSKDLSSDITKNKVITINTLTIGMGSKQIDIGVILNDVTYCVSPAYSTFQIQTEIVEPCFLYYMMCQINSVISSKYMITGARQGKSVDKKGLMEHKVFLPSLEEQKKIADALSAMDAKISAVAREITLMETFKKGLLQQMFV